MPISLTKITRGTKALASKANEILQKLEEIRIKHSDEDGFASPLEAFNTTYNQQNAKIQQSYPKLIKTYVTQLEKSSYINESFSTQMEIPNVGDLIKAVDYYNNCIDVVNALDDICANKEDFSNDSVESVQSNKSNRGNFGDNGNKSDHWNMHNFCSG